VAIAQIPKGLLDAPHIGKTSSPTRRHKIDQPDGRARVRRRLVEESSERQRQVTGVGCLRLPTGCGQISLSVDAIDRVVMNSRLHYLGSAARIMEPVQRLAVLTCMDARVDVSGLLGLRPGDAHVIRNAGGRATNDALRCLAVSQALLGTREVMVMHHTECALGRFSQAELAARITTATGHAFTEDLDCFTDPIAAVLEDVERLKAYTSLVHRDKIRGFVYDLSANTLTEVLAPKAPAR
jgi:carbonic anhydrase